VNAVELEEGRNNDSCSIGLNLILVGLENLEILNKRYRRMKTILIPGKKETRQWMEEDI